MRKKQSPHKSHLFRRLYINLFILILLVSGQNVFYLWLANLRNQAFDTVTQTLLAEREARHLLNIVIDRERNTIESYNSERFAFNNSFNRLYKLLQDNPSQLTQLNRIKYLYNQQQNEFSQEKVARITSDYSKEKMALFDSLRAQIDSLILQEEQLLDEKRNWLHKLSYINIFINIFSMSVILLLVGFNTWLLHRRAKRPLLNLLKVSKLWRQGQMEAQVNYSSSDEVGELTEVLNTMTNEMHQRQTLIKKRNQHLEDLIAALSHDLRTPLVGINNTVDSMLKGAFGPVNHTWREVFEEYRQANKDLLKLVEVLLDVSRYEAGYGANLNWEPLNWERIVVKTITQIKIKSKCHCLIDYKISQSLPIVYGDEIEIQRVLQNLLDNAVYVSEPNKEIFLDVTTFKKVGVKVSVQDRGPGIAPQEKDKLFHRFVQGRGRRGRSGLGLYLCRQIIEAHKGKIGVESSLGKGSTFWFTLSEDVRKV